ncbi:hypothetical protein POM88_043523 [Heracleum sosnowskyi]|uniref:EMC1 first beta-propeller domain-containing protein n=1 Tax=Heracleum sosnowskyi TaxID=360622 RepID=A0AAD8H228_9APIA|nr:hypothetical protein POM88_043523 [Heracleum sosnowskyi]
MAISRVFTLLLLLFTVFNFSHSLHEDQVSLMDWHQQYIGKVKQAVFQTQKAGRKRVIVATEENVVASLDLRRGEIFWRKVLGAKDAVDEIDWRSENNEFDRRSERVKCVDLHPTQPWALISLYSGTVCIWNYQSQEIEKSFKLTESPVRCAKFIRGKDWFIAGADDKMIRVYNYCTAEKLKNSKHTQTTSGQWMCIQAFHNS